MTLFLSSPSALCLCFVWPLCLLPGKVPATHCHFGFVFWSGMTPGVREGVRLATKLGDPPAEIILLQRLIAGEVVNEDDLCVAGNFICLFGKSLRHRCN